MSWEGEKPTAVQDLERIQAVTDAALAHLDLERLLGELLDRVRETLRADTAAVLLIDDSGNRLVARAARGLEEEVRQGVQIPVGEGFAGRIAATGRPVVLHRVDHRNVLNPILREKGVVSLMGVPLVVEGRTIGVVHVGTLEAHRFGTADVDLLRMVADRVALAIHARRAEEDRAAAYILQRSLLPTALPTIPGLELAARYAPGEGGEVGGDWYDVFSLSSGEVVLAMGDVAGRGLRAAIVMSRARNVLRSYALVSSDPAEMLTRLDEMFLHFEARELITVFVGVLDPLFGSIRYSSAGHHAPVLASSSGPNHFLEVRNDPPIGIAEYPRRQSQMREVPAGSTLYLFTDGLVERRNQALDQGLEKLRQAAAATNPDEGCVSILLSLVGGRTLDDDLALLGVHFPDLAKHPLHLTLPAEAGSLKLVRDGVFRWLRARDARESVIQDVQLAVSEACTNTIRHAYPGTAGAIEVRVAERGSGVLLEVIDKGTWKPHRKAPGGRGIPLMDAMTDELDISTGSEGTTVKMRKRISGDHR